MTLGVFRPPSGKVERVNFFIFLLLFLLILSPAITLGLLVNTLFYLLLFFLVLLIPLTLAERSRRDNPSTEPRRASRDDQAKR